MTHVSLDASLVVPDDVIFRELDGEAIILNLATGNYFGLDEVGTRMWTLIADSGTLRHTVDVMAGEYDVDRAALEGDVLDLASGLLDKGLVQVKA
jgi:hypothetical protein